MGPGQVLRLPAPTGRGTSRPSGISLGVQPLHQKCCLGKVPDGHHELPVRNCHLVVRLALTAGTRQKEEESEPLPEVTPSTREDNGRIRTLQIRMLPRLRELLERCKEQTCCRPAGD